MIRILHALSHLNDHASLNAIQTFIVAHTLPSLNRFNLEKSIDMLIERDFITSGYKDFCRGFSLTPAGETLLKVRFVDLQRAALKRRV